MGLTFRTVRFADVEDDPRFPQIAEAREVWHDETSPVLCGEIDGQPVVRILIDRHRVDLGGYAGTEHLRDRCTLVALIEVAGRHRRRGIGTAALVRLRQEFPDRRFAAFSEAADEFWERQGWSRHTHREPGAQTLFVSSAR